jgi:hypothetical protein
VRHWARRALGTLLVGTLLVGTLASVLASAAYAEPTTVSVECVPGPACGGWFRSPVTVKWHTPNATGVAPGTCVSAQTFYSDTRGTKSSCIAWQDTQATGQTSSEVVIKIDSTPPTLTAAVADRPPDYGGWFNHPVSFSFQGTDATSGMHSCGSAVYSGPDGPGVNISGSCRDVAGNSATGSFPLNYDATPPPAPVVEATPGNGQIALRWSATPLTEAEVVRVGTAAADAAVYRGPAAEFTDGSLRNERRYRYIVTLIDQAGNRAASTTSAVPTASMLLSPARRARVHGPPLLRWKRARKASYYNVQLFRGSRKVLSRWPRVNRLQLRKSWRYAGRRRRLAPGRYCWYVWPGHGKRSQRDYGRVLGKKCFRVVG